MPALTALATIMALGALGAPVPLGTTRAHPQPSPRPGASLTKGMRLVYASQGRELAPWSIDSLDLAAEFGGRTSCSVVRFGARDLRRGCVERDTLYAWSESAGGLVASRPVGAGMSMRVAGANGATLLYETSAADLFRVSGMDVPVLATTVTTTNASGTVVRRLRERYALSLATAVDGTFEVPSDTARGGWTTERAFSLVRIEGAGQPRPGGAGRGP